MRLGINNQLKIPNRKYDVIFVAKLFLNDRNEYFAGGAEIHLRSVLANVQKLGKTVAVVQLSSDSDSVVDKDGIFVIKVESHNTWEFRWRLRHILSRINTCKSYFN